MYECRSASELLTMSASFLEQGPQFVRSPRGMVALRPSTWLAVSCLPVQEPVSVRQSLFECFGVSDEISAPRHRRTRRAPGCALDQSHEEGASGLDPRVLSKICQLFPSDELASLAPAPTIQMFFLAPPARRRSSSMTCQANTTWLGGKPLLFVLRG